MQLGQQPVKSFSLDQLINKQIIIVDDNKTYCDVVMERAATLGMKANAFLSVESAWEWQLGNQRPDIIITDLDISEQDGIELISRLYLHHELRHIPDN